MKIRAVCVAFAFFAALCAQNARDEESQDYFKKWLEYDAKYLVTGEELSVFSQLGTEDEKVAFIEAFWRRRDPNPATPANEFKEEHYRRIAYANEWFSAGKPGWLTDRGMIYIKFGPPTQRDVYPTGTVLTDYRSAVAQAIEGRVERGVAGREIVTTPFEVWTYSYIEGIGTDVTLEFVDRSGAGLYHLAMSKEEKNLFAHRDPAADVASLNQSDLFKRSKERQFYQTEIMAQVRDAPAVQFRDLQQAVSARVSYDQLALKVETGYIQVTDNSFYLPVTMTLSASELDFRPNGDSLKASVEVFIQATNVQKRVVAVAEDTLNLQGPARDLEQMRRGHAVYAKKLLLPPGRYVVDVAAKDENNGKMGTLQELVVIPDRQDRLSLSSLILADLMRPLGDDEDLSDPFAMGSHKVIPNVGRSFDKSQQAGLFFQIYGLALDQSSSLPEAEIEIRLKHQERTLMTIADDLSGFGHISGDQASITVSVPLSKFPSGRIHVEVEVKDKLTARSVSAATDFTVRQPDAPASKESP